MQCACLPYHLRVSELISYREERTFQFYAQVGVAQMVALEDEGPFDLAAIYLLNVTHVDKHRCHCSRNITWGTNEGGPPVPVCPSDSWAVGSGAIVLGCWDQDHCSYYTPLHCWGRRGSIDGEGSGKAMPPGV